MEEINKSIAIRTLNQNVIANLTQVITGLLLTFILYRYINDTLGVATLGVWSVVLATTSASRLADLGMSASVTRFVARHLARNEIKTASEVIETATLSILMLIIIVLPNIYWLLVLILKKIFQGNELVLAYSVLPYSIVSLGISMLSAVSQAGIDGCQRMDLRAWLLVLGQVLMIGLAFMLIPRNGIIGLAWSQIGQSIFLVISGWYLLKSKSEIKYLPWIPHHFSKSLFKEMLNFGVQIQIGTLISLLFDPTTKILLAKFGGASVTGYFEVANQLVVKIRSLIIAGNQVIVPRVAMYSEDEKKILHMYIVNFNIILDVSLIFFALVVIFGWLSSLVFLGEVKKDFILILQICSLGWLLNIINVPAWLINIGRGTVKWNTITTITISVINGGFGWLAGKYFGINGIILVYTVALFIGGVGLFTVFQVIHKISPNALGLQKHIRLTFFTLTSIVIMVSVNQYTDSIKVLLVVSILLTIVILLSALTVIKKSEYSTG